MTSIDDALGRLWDADDGDRMLECDGRWASWVPFGHSPSGSTGN
ncbi:AMP-dependent synthetase and ligase domain protein [Mycobacterium avium subsp. avium 2285 (R)]|nr:AMP-dependent synthetase and ligase domain protein [Mycobacterium avium subsp. avium 2285 (R)]